MSNATQIGEKLRQKLAETLRSLPPILAEETRNFSLESFQQEAWQGFKHEAWPQRKKQTWSKTDNSQKNILVNTGNLRSSIRIDEIRGNRVRIVAGGSAAPYARVHNFGFRGKVNQRVKSHTRIVKGSKIKVKAHNRTMMQNIPQRRFIGGEESSPELKRRLYAIVRNELKNTLK